MAVNEMDKREQAFCDPRSPEVFHSVQHKHDIWNPDPFDVEFIHKEARTTFSRLVDRATAEPVPDSGRILLIKGEAGSGKTHLMRGFRNEVHANAHGYFGYLQLTTSSEAYHRYILRNLIDSLDKPYHPDSGGQTGLRRLSAGMAEVPATMQRRFRDGKYPLEMLREQENLDVNRLVLFLAKEIIKEPRFERVDIDLVRALLYLQRDNAYLKTLVLKYLRCEPLGEADQQALGGLSARTEDEDASQLLSQMGLLMQRVHSAALVICVDQLEDIYNWVESEQHFRRVMTALRATIDNVPSAVVVIACLEDYYDQLRESLIAPVLDRIERNPSPIYLKAHRTEDEVFELVRRRLEYLFGEMDVEIDTGNPYYPFNKELLKKHAGVRTRDVLDWCQTCHEESIKQNQIIINDDMIETDGECEDQFPEFTRKWNDFRIDYIADIPKNEAELARLFADSIKASMRELSTTHALKIHHEGRFIYVNGLERPLLIGVCNKQAPGGWLERQLLELESLANSRTMGIIRSTEFPKSAQSKVGKQLARIKKKNARTAVVQESEWRVMLAYKDFEKEHGHLECFSEWLKHEAPISKQQSLREIVLNYLKIGSKPNTPDEPIIDPPPPPPPPPPPVPSGLILGHHRDTNEPLTEQPGAFRRHAAFLGGTGSGKTTLALNVVEQLLLEGTPVILIDRKGDLCGYGDPARWDEAANGSERPQDLEGLREAVDVAVYTPGDPRGRPLSLVLLPKDASKLHSVQREQIAKNTTDNLCDMMAYGNGRRYIGCRAILKTALELACENGMAAGLTLSSLSDFIRNEDPDLLNRVGNVDLKLFDSLSEDLNFLYLNKGSLLARDCETIDIERLLGKGDTATPGKTRLSIISTRFLGDNLDVQFWVAQFLQELIQWSAKAPSESLQAVVLFDEADIYLPAQRKPATKGPMEHLLKRARSAGLGIFLATQSPGDMDYKCRDNIRSWFLGRIQERTAVDKLRAALEDVGAEVYVKLAGHNTGEFFFAREGKVEPFKAQRNLIDAQQLPEDRILDVAQRTVQRAQRAG